MSNDFDDPAVATEWYALHAKKARWMDLIGDYAGDELFIVDGESLVQRVLDDSLLDVGRSEGVGFQAVHVVYLMEIFLKQFLTRNARIEIVFFRYCSHASTHPGGNAFVYASRKLARQVLINHMEYLSIPVFHFENLMDPHWKLHEKSFRPMFALMSDSVKSTPLDSRYTAIQRDHIFNMLIGGLSVALMNGIEFRDSKIMSFVLERTRNVPNQPPWSMARVVAQLSVKAELHRQHEATLTKDVVKSRQDLLVALIQALLGVGESTSHWRTLVFVFTLHILLLNVTPLRNRIQPSLRFPNPVETQLRDDILPRLFAVTADILAAFPISLDVDASLFFQLLRYLRNIDPNRAVSEEVWTAFTEIWREGAGEMVPSGCIALSVDAFHLSEVLPSHFLSMDAAVSSALLPFSHPVFDHALASIHVDATAEDVSTRQPYFDTAYVFSDTQHWHNDNPLITVGDTGVQKRNQRILRSHQRYMRNLQRQAETLTGALGRGLRQITITVNKAKANEKRLGAKEKVPQQISHKKVKAKPMSKADRMRQAIAEEKSAKTDKDSREWFSKYLEERPTDTIAQKLTSLDAICRNPRFSEPWLRTESQLYRIHLLFSLWIYHTEPESAATRDEFTVSILRTVMEIAQQVPLTPERGRVVSDVLEVLGFGEYRSQVVSVATGVLPSPLTFKFVKLLKSSGRVYPWMKITEHPIRWQLRLYGEYMDRSMDSAPDSRVDFEPDEWQRRALNCIDDADCSLLVVAPTSAGKTFISFYAMEKVLRESDDGLIVYIAPTKALVNQIVAEVYARFSKKMKHGSLWAVHTRDWRINDPHNCQILVTVPEVLAIMLLSPPLAAKWTPRIKRIILDEIHTMGQQEGGPVWEQILLLSPCPFIGLSATIGFPERFSNWLQSVAEAHGFKYTLIQHKHRYSHLRKFYYRLEGAGSEHTPFTGLGNHNASNRLRFLHPISMLGFGYRTLPDDLALEARDTLSLYDALQSQEIILPAVHPVRFLTSPQPSFLKQSDVLRYETALKQVISKAHSHSPGFLVDVDKVVSYLQDSPAFEDNPTKPDFLEGILSLVVDLDKQKLLPTIFFNFDRKMCDLIAQNLLKKLDMAEAVYKNGSDAWRRKVSQWEEWKLEEKLRQRLHEKTSKARRKTDNDEFWEDPADKAAWQSTFDPDATLPEFSFTGRFSAHELNKEISELWNMDHTSWLFRALRRGIAVHHAGQNKAYRGLIENLFRRGVIRVMISTGTLALGINAPARTSVFVGDSPFLTALMYRQCAGRAGRRGYDLLGNVVFYGVPIDRIQRLVLSRLPPLGGAFPLTPTLTLRLLNLLHGSNNAQIAVTSIQSMMKLAQISFGSDVGQKQLLHHMRFNVEYLRRTCLIDATGAPVNLTAIASHLYYTEPSNFALVLLMHRGVLHRISEGIDAEGNFILLMSHLFGRQYLPGAFAGSAELSNLRTRYPSMIVLPPIPEDARCLLVEHDATVRKIFTNYALTYATQYATDLGADDILPLSTISHKGSDDISPFSQHLAKTALQPRVRSSFIAASGHADSFGSVEELAHSARTGIHFSEYAIPNILSHIDQGGEERLLNAYLLDFFVHGQVSTLHKANGIRPGDVWYLLEDFHLTLRTLEASLRQYLIGVSAAQSDKLSSDGPSCVDNDEGDNMDGSLLEHTEALEDLFPRPEGVSDEDWRLYGMVHNATARFQKNFRAMWA